ncbi:Golgi apparatus membrane protein TVP15 [Phytophthora cactorum]|nr:Golgi apparatus membrane protein TVP15 [Phytophthora cactorum]
MNPSNPFQDPSVLRAQSPPSPGINFSTMSAPEPAAPVGGAAPSSYQAAPGAPRQNLMDEIGAQIKATNSQTIIKVMRVLNLVLATATITVGVLAWIFGQVDTFQKVIAGIYIIMFGALLLAFELRTEKVDVILRKNFGFMYGNKTRTMFLVFIAIWPLSMGNFWLTILDAVLLFLNAFFNYFVISQHPAFSTVPPVYDPNQPQAGGYAPAPHMNVYTELKVWKSKYNPTDPLGAVDQTTRPKMQQLGGISGRSKLERKKARLNRRKIAAEAERDALAQEQETARVAAISRSRLRRLPPWLPTLPSTNLGDAAVLRDLNDVTRPVALRVGQEMTRYCVYTQRVVDDARQHIDAAIAHITEGVRKIWPHASVTCFGSYSTGLWLPSSDVDVVVMGLSNSEDRDVPTRFIPDGVKQLEQLARQLRPQKSWVQRVDVVRGAKVPVAKVILRRGSQKEGEGSALLRVDISIENVQTSHGMEASKLVRQYVSDLPRLKPLLMVLRQFLREKALNSAFTGGLSSYAVTLLAVFMMEMQRHQEEDDDSDDADETPEEKDARKLGQLLLDFLEYYGTSFDYFTTGLSLKPEAFGAYLLAAHLSITNGLPLMPQLVIDDPVYKNGQHNVAAGAFALARVVAALENGYFALWYHRSTQFTPTPLCQLLHWSGHQARDVDTAKQ